MGQYLREDQIGLTGGTVITRVALYGTGGTASTGIAAMGDAVAPAGVTYTRVNINQVATPGTKALKAALASNYTRLHFLYGHMSAAGTVQLVDSDATEIISPINVAANGCVSMNFGLGKTLAPISAVGKGMSLVSVTGAFNGYAVVSQATS